MPQIANIIKHEQIEVAPPAAARLRPDGNPPRAVRWRASFIDDTGFEHFAQLFYEVLETHLVQNDIRAQVDGAGNPVLDDNGDQVFDVVPVSIPNPSPSAAALLAQGLVDEAVDADIARVKAALEDPNSPVGG